MGRNHISQFYKLDRDFQNEIKKVANGDGSKEYSIQLANELMRISIELENRYKYNACIKKYGREKVALCTATTIIQNKHRHETQQIRWALAVMDLWKNRNPRSIYAATINIHPAILSDNSSSLRKLTTNM